jgi:hypothetical protein
MTDKVMDNAAEINLKITSIVGIHATIDEPNAQPAKAAALLT